MGKQKSGLLWQVQGAQLQQTSYVFGTMHVKNQSILSKLEQLENYILQTDAFAAEYHLDESMEAQNFSGAFQARSKEPLRYKLGEKKYQKYRKIIQNSVQLDLDHLASLRPLIIANLIEERMLPQEKGPVALDIHLWQFAKHHNKTLLGLETLKEQMQTLEGIDAQQEFAAFIGLCRNISAHHRQLHKMYNWYLSGNIRALYQATQKGLGKNRYTMLHKRNQIMSDRLLLILPEQSVFAAVGAAHLGGKNGLLAQLKRSGLKVTALPY